MVKLHDEIADTFLEQLKESSDVTPAMIDALRELLSGKKKLKADDLVNVFASQSGGEVK